MNRVEWAPGDTVPVRVTGDGDTVFVLAHGAGTNQDHPATATLRDALAARGLTVVTFDYPYAAAGRRAPDRAPTLTACHRAVVEWARSHVGSELVLGGRSMGGRMASMLVADGVDCRALVAYAYPLHPPGRPDRLRIDHLAAISVPVLVVRGTRDAFSRSDLADRYLRSRFDVVDVEGADHSFRGRGRSVEEVADILAGITVTWLAGLS